MFDSKLTPKLISLLVFLPAFFASSAYGFQELDAGINVRVLVDNADNEADPKSPADFHFMVERAGVPTGYVFLGSESGTTVPVDGGTVDRFTIRSVVTHPRYMPVFEGDCDDFGSLHVGRNTIQECVVTLSFISFSDGTSVQKIISVKVLVDNTDASGRTAPLPSDFKFAVESFDQSVSIEFRGSTDGVNIAYSRPQFFAIRALNNPDYPDYLSTPSCKVDDSRIVECGIEISYINTRLEPGADSVVNIRTTIERTDPNKTPPAVEDFPIEILREGRRVTQVTSSALGINIAGERRSGEVLEIEVAQNSRFRNYLPIVECGGADTPFVVLHPGQKKFCTVKIYYLDVVIGSDPTRILSVSKQIFNSQIPGETSDPGDFTIDLYNQFPFPEGTSYLRVEGSNTPKLIGYDDDAVVQVRELPNPEYRNYFPTYSSQCRFSGATFRECIISNYSLRFPDDQALAILRVVTHIESVDPAGERVPTAGDFRIQVKREREVIDEFAGSEAGWNLPLSDAADVEVAPLLNPAFERYVATVECRDLTEDASVWRSTLCVVTINYMDGGSAGQPNSAYRIIKNLVQPTGVQTTEGEFSIGVFENIDQDAVPIIVVPGSPEGVIVGIESGLARGIVREIGRPPQYIESYSPGCGTVALQAGGFSTCVVTNTYIGAVPPVAEVQEVITDEDRAVSVRLTATDPDSSELVFQIVQQPAFGTLAGTLPNLTYTPNPNFNGDDSLRFRVHDGQFFSAVATIPIRVRPVNDAPVATGRTVSAITETSTQIQLFATDVDGDGLTASILTAPSAGVVSISGLIATYTSRNDYIGQDSFTFQASDGQAFSNPATVTVNVQNGIAITSVSKLEGNSGINPFVFNVELLAPSPSNVSVNYATQNVTALAGSDYTARSGTIRFVGGGPLVIPIAVDVLGDRVFEQSETFRLTLSSPAGAVLRNAFGTGTILNDDPQVGIASMSPTELTVDVLTPFTIDLTWIHPERWRLLDEIEFRIVDDTDTAMWVKFEENGTELPFRHYNVKSRKYGDPVLPGSDVIFDTNLAKMFVANSVVIGSGPTGPSATVRPSLQFKPKARGRTFRVELFVSDDLGNQQGWEHVGNIIVR